MKGSVFLEAGDLVLRTFESYDFETYREAVVPAETLSRMLESRPGTEFSHRQNLEEQWLRHERNIFLVVELKGEPAGYLFLRHEDRQEAEVGVLVREEFRSRGVGRRSVSAFLDYVFDDLNYHRVLARILETNQASLKLFEGLGFEREGEEREKFFTGGEHRNLVRMGVLEDEWRSRQ
jgi:RimJ/RimL family protein N-acetyltransferase